MKTIEIRPSWTELLPCELNEAELAACLDEAVRRGINVPLVEVGLAYEAMLEGRSALAAVLLSRALFPNGGDTIKGRVEARKRLAVKNQKAA